MDWNSVGNTKYYKRYRVWSMSGSGFIFCILVNDIQRQRIYLPLYLIWLKFSMTSWKCWLKRPTWNQNVWSDVWLAFFQERVSEHELFLYTQEFFTFSSSRTKFLVNMWKSGTTGQKWETVIFCKNCSPMLAGKGRDLDLSMTLIRTRRFFFPY